MESQIVTNQEMFGFFTNFDHWIDFVALSLWVAGLGTLAFGVLLLVRGRNDTDEEGKWGGEPSTANISDQTDIVEEDNMHSKMDQTESSDAEVPSGNVDDITIE